MNAASPDWLYVLLSGIGAFGSGFWGVRVGMARMEERLIALTERVKRIEDRLDDNDDAAYRWRHDEYSPQITEIWAEVRPIKAIVERIERRGQHKP